MSDKPATLIEALSQLQGRLPKIERTHTANVKTQQGSFTYSYAGLAEVNSAVLPLMSELGLAFLCKPTIVDGHLVLTYSLAHVSGETTGGTYPLPPPGASPQAIGSAISYARRYVLSAMVGVGTVDDDDGAAAGAEAPGTARGGRRRQADAGTQDRAPDEAQSATPRQSTDGQRKAMHAGFAELGLGGDDNRPTRLQVAARLAGVESLASTSELTYEQARRVLDGIAAKRREQCAQVPAEAAG
jgi:hypothetical protein